MFLKILSIKVSFLVTVAHFLGQNFASSKIGHWASFCDRFSLSVKNLCVKSNFFCKICCNNGIDISEVFVK